MCQEQVEQNSILCDQDFCKDFYKTILLPTEQLIAVIEKNQSDWTHFFPLFFSLSLTAQIWLLVHYNFPNKIFWESVSYLDSQDLWAIIASNEDFRLKFFTMITPNLKQEVEKEMQTWISQDKEKTIELTVIVEKLENFIFMILEFISTISVQETKLPND
ncbi:MAG: hypothetical protein HeimC3_23820 [Candidatus Heimdallarchaeota archaeon LC_3]|nr:MAG: hypothetical protein HeimC3_23820 [Candidatus Heimdallarchaeota archaeon LC_3]